MRLDLFERERERVVLHAFIISSLLVFAKCYFTKSYPQAEKIILLFPFQNHFLNQSLQSIKRQPDPKGFFGPFVEKRIGPTFSGKIVHSQDDSKKQNADKKQ